MEDVFVGTCRMRYQQSSTTKGGGAIGEKEEKTQIKDRELIIYAHRMQKINLVVHKSQTEIMAGRKEKTESKIIVGASVSYPNPRVHHA